LFQRTDLEVDPDSEKMLLARAAYWCSAVLTFLKTFGAYTFYAVIFTCYIGRIGWWTNHLVLGGVVAVADCPSRLWMGICPAYEHAQIDVVDDACWSIVSAACRSRGHRTRV
jgi:hypothetical protein